MRNAALFLGVIGGILAMGVGFFGYGYTMRIERFGEIPDLAEQVENVGLVRAASLGAPLLAIAGGAMARVRALWGGLMMLVAAGGIYWAFGFNVLTMFPISMCAMGGLLAVAAGKPDEPRAHF